MLLLQQVLACSVSPLPSSAVAVIRIIVVLNSDRSLLLPPDLPVQLPQPVVPRRGADAGGPGGGGPGEAAGGGDDRWPGGAAPILLLLVSIRAVLQDVPADEAVSGLGVSVGWEPGVVMLLDVLLQGQKSDFVSLKRIVMYQNVSSYFNTAYLKPSSVEVESPVLTWKFDDSLESSEERDPLLATLLFLLLCFDSLLLAFLWPQTHFDFEELSELRLAVSKRSWGRLDTDFDFLIPFAVSYLLWIPYYCQTEAVTRSVLCDSVWFVRHLVPYWLLLNFLAPYCTGINQDKVFVYQSC